MTGFARASGVHGELHWAWEARSVNGRGLEVRCRLPTGYEALDGPLRAAVGKRFARGNLNLTLQIARAAGATAIRINEEALQRLIEAARIHAVRHQLEAPRIEGLMALRGVVEAIELEETEEARAAREAALLAGLEAALGALAKARADEGRHLVAVLDRLLVEMAGLVQSARQLAAAQPQQIRQRLKLQLAELLQGSAAVPEDRLALEIALLATKADVREELDRLEGHIAAARGLMAGAAAAGRRFDFLAQEFNREANTLCSKSADPQLTTIGLDLKAAIERLREQVQNVE
ncbi:MAG: YicC family protein [Alphaproteobacteria bacterium]|nr:YicC family protein [Alphaproteobacteria bacterium]